MLKQFKTLFSSVLLSGEKNCVFARGEGVVSTFSFWLPDFKVVDLRKDSAFVSFLLYGIALSLSHYKQNQQTGVTLFATWRNPLLLKAYRLLHPRKKVILRLHDPIAHIPLEHMTQGSFSKVALILLDLVKTRVIDVVDFYDEKDYKLITSFLGKEYQIHFRYKPNAINEKILGKIDASKSEYLYYFIGSTNKRHDRLSDFAPVRGEIKKLYTNLDSSCFKEQLVLHGKDVVPYKDYLRELAKSKIIVDLYRVYPDEGLSFRVAEALFLNRKIITNRTRVLDLDVYNPSRFFVIGYDELKRLRDFIECDISPITKKDLKNYDITTWF